LAALFFWRCKAQFGTEPGRCAGFFIAGFLLIEIDDTAGLSHQQSCMAITTCCTFADKHITKAKVADCVTGDKLAS
jgi:hypothetical protein